jgi:hypothetical protein
MKPITQIEFRDISIQFLVEKNSIGYSFGYDGRNYGQRVEVTKKGKQALVDAVALLTINAIESYENLKNGKDTNTTTA